MGKREAKKKAAVSGSAALELLLERLKNGTFGELLDDWRWIFGYTRRYQWAVLLYVILGVLSSSLGLVSAVASKYTIDIITGYQTSKLAEMIALMIGSTLFSLVFKSLISRVSTKISLVVNNDIQASVFERVLDADWLSLSQYANGDILNRFNSDVSTVASNAVSWLPNLIVSLYTFVATFFVILHYDVTMGFLALASAPVLLFSSRFLLKRMRAHNEAVKEMTSTLMTFESETFYNLDTIKSFGLMERCAIRLRHWQRKFKRLSLEYNLFTIQTEALLSLLGSAVQMAAFGYCLYLLWSGQIVYGTMTLFLSQSTKLSSTFSTLVGVVPSFLSTAVSARRVRELVQLKKEPHISSSSFLDPFIPDGFQVCMSDLTFSYGETPPVIRQSDFIARPGEIVALVGPSGEGKTTMIRLMLGLVRPQKGRVYLKASGGLEVEMNAETRHLFSYVPQGNTLLSGTVAENLRMVKESATDEELEEVLRLSCAWDFVSQLPQGIHSPLGERGRGLSEGQAQRLAIARALLKDAPVLLLDEATSALDVATERQVLRNLVRRRPNKTCIVTTHRPSVLSLCQRVYRVMDGQVTQLSEAESSRMAMEF